MRIPFSNVAPFRSTGGAHQDTVSDNEVQDNPKLTPALLSNMVDLVQLVVIRRDGSLFGVLFRACRENGASVADEGQLSLFIFRERCIHRCLASQRRPVFHVAFHERSTLTTTWVR